jgi:hypothetical protein
LETKVIKKMITFAEAKITKEQENEFFADKHYQIAE